MVGRVRWCCHFLVLYLYTICLIMHAMETTNCKELVGHTPGPWKFSVDRYDNHLVDIPCHPDCGFDHSTVRVHLGYTDECGANARLIAAAPELLEALQLALQRAECDLRMWPLKDKGSVEHQSLTTATTKFRAAIAKAEGHS